MPADNTRFLVEAAQRRSHDTRERAEAAIKRLDAQGDPVTFNTVARAAGVSRNWLYATPHIRREIERLRDQRRSSVRQVPAAQRPSPQSKEALLELLRAKNRQLAADVRRLNDELARAHGRICELQAAVALSARPTR